MVMKNVTKKIQKIPYLFLLMLFSFVTASAQKGITVRGTVLDSNGETIIGASVVLRVIIHRYDFRYRWKFCIDCTQ